MMWTELVLCLLTAGATIAAEPQPVALRAGSVAPYAGVLLSNVRAATLERKAAALVELRTALAARSAEATALRSSVALHQEREAKYKAEADSATRAAGMQRAANRAEKAKGLATGVAIGHIAVRVISWLLGGL